MIKRIPALYNRQELIEGLCPPDRVVIYLTGSVLIPRKSMEFLFELVEGLILIGCAEIFVVSDTMINQSIASFTLDEEFPNIQKLIRECRPYVKFHAVNRQYILDNADDLNIDNFIVIHTEKATDVDKDFCDMIDDVYVAHTMTYEVAYVTTASLHLTDEVEVINELLKESTMSAQALLLVNIICKKEAFSQRGVKFSAYEFLEKVAGHTMSELDITARAAPARLQSDGTPAPPREGMPSREEIATFCSRHNVSTLTELARQKNLNPATVRTRIKLGWTLKDALGVTE